MSTFSVWWKSDRSTPRQFTWLCGSERPLVDYIVGSITEALEPDTWDHFPYDAETDSAEEIWASINQYPLSVNPRLIVVKAAHLLDPARISELLRNRRFSPSTYVIFISDETKIPRVELPDKTTERPAHLRAFQNKGYVIECTPFTQATAKYAVQWVQSMKSMRSGVASHLLERCNGNIRLARDLCNKLSMFPQEPTISMVNELLREHPRESFASSLLSLDRKTAILALRELPPEEYAGVIGILDANVDLAGLVHDMLVQHKSNSEISKAAGSRRFLVPDILPVARHYNPTRRASIRRLLTDADETLRLGERVGVMEALIAYW